MKFEEFKNLDVFKQASQVSTIVFELSATKPTKQASEIMQQIKKLAVGLLSNVTEACGKDDAEDALRFLNLSKLKLNELEEMLERAHKAGFLSYFKLKRCSKQIKKMHILLVSYIAYHQRLMRLEEPRLKYAG